jgi:pilus assembly protein CpaE
MATDGEIRLLWATLDDATSGEVVRTTAADLGIAVHTCTPNELADLVRPSRFDLVGLELAREPREGLALLRQLHERFPRTPLMAAVSDSGVATIRAALEAGASDVLSLPLTANELAKALLKFRQTRHRDAATPGAVGQILTVYGVRGGLGTTTLAVNLGIQLAATAHGPVAIGDLDLQRGDVTTFLNLSSIESIASIATSSGEIDEIFLHGTLTRHGSGLSVLPAPQQIEEAEAVGPEEVKIALNLLRSQFAFTVVDTPRSITGATAVAFEMADRILLLTDLSIPSVRAARRFVDLLDRLGVGTDRVDLLVMELTKGGVDLKDLTRSIGKEPLATLPRDDAAAAHAMNSGTPLNGGRPAGLSVAVAELAAKLSGSTQPAKARTSLFRRIFAKEATS